MDCTQLRRELRSLAMKRDGGTAARLTADFNVAPGDSMIPAGPDGFHRSFFRGKARGIALHAVGLRFAIADLGLGKDSANEAVAEPFDGCFDARYFRYVDACADNHADQFSGPNALRKQQLLN